MYAWYLIIAKGCSRHVTPFIAKVIESLLN